MIKYISIKVNSRFIFTSTSETKLTEIKKENPQINLNICTFAPQILRYTLSLKILVVCIPTNHDEK